MTAPMYNPTAAPTGKAIAMAHGLRQLAADLESGALPVPFDISITAFWALGDDGHITERLTAEDARQAMTAAPGSWSKEYTGNYVSYRKSYGGGHVTYDISMDRTEVCRRVQVGTKEVPATDATTEPVYEWVCDDGAP